MNFVLILRVVGIAFQKVRAYNINAGHIETNLIKKTDLNEVLEASKVI